MKTVCTQLVFLISVLVLSTLSTSVEHGPRTRKRRGSIPGAVLTLTSLTTQGGLSGNSDPPCETPLPAEDSVHCPEGFAKFKDADGVVCLRLSSNSTYPMNAEEMCQTFGAHLVSIRSAERQRTIEEFLKSVPGSTDLYAVWIGLKSSSSASRTLGYFWPDNVALNYSNWRNPNVGTYYDQCVELSTNEYWWNQRTCNREKPFICDFIPECPPTTFGKQCEKKCHCHGDTDCAGGKHCQYGCQAGWMGPTCCARKKKADVAYYCVNSKQQGRYLLLRIDPKDVAYDVLTAVDISGRPMPWCNGTYVSHDADGYTIKIPVIDNVDVNNNAVPGPTCPGKKTGNVYTWKIKLQETEGLALPYDRFMQLTCDFRHADTFTRGTEHSFRHLLNRSEDLANVETIEETKVDVVLQIIDPFTNDVVQQAPLGSNVALQMILQVEGGVLAQDVYSYNCLAATPNGEEVRELTDYYGCPLSTSPFSSISGANGTVTTGPFPLFAFPGFQDVTFSCSFGLCFSEQTQCQESCDKNNRRKKRASGNLGTHRKVTAKVHILPDPNANSAESNHSSAAEMMTPVTWFLLVAVVITSALLVYLLFVRSRQPTKSIR